MSVGPMSKESKRKMSLAHKGKPSNMLGHNHSEESKVKMSLSHSGVNLTKEHSLNISKSLRGRVFTDEWKRKISESKKKEWKDGVYDNILIGSFKAGYRADIGHFVRSSWEANFARILNYEHIDYEYEPERFDLGYTSYLPDFYLLEKDIYIEIKGRDSKEDKDKRIMCRKIHSVRIKVIKPDKYQELKNQYRYLVPDWEE